MYRKALKPATKSGIFFWNMAGSVCNAANTVLMTLIITRICGAETAGIYSLALAVGQIVSPVAYFEVRNFQVSDIRHEFSFSEYHLFRLITIIAASVFTVIWILLNGYSGEKLSAVILCCIFQLIEAYENVFQGLLQLNNRLDLSGKSFTLRVVFDTVLFWGLLVLTQNFFLSLLVYTIFAGIWIFVITVPISNHFEKAHRTSLSFIPQLAAACLPLFLTTFLMSYIISAPKYAIDEFLSPDMQTYFSILFMPASVVNLFTFVIYRLYITKMAEDWVNGNRKDFMRQVLLLLLWIALIGTATLLIGWWIGIPFLSWFYGLPQLSAYRPELMIVLLGGIFAATAGWFNVVFTIIRNQKILLVVNAVAAVCCFLIVRPMVQNFALRGASLCYMVSMAILTLVQIVFILYFLKQSKKGTEF